MAIYHCSIKIGSRGKGQSAVAAAAYRSGSKLTDKEIGITSDYTRKGGVIFSEISLCPNAPAEYAEREVLWNAVHQIEKTKDARLWREIEVALPKELNRAEQIETVREYVKGLTTQGMCADWSLHDKGDGNPHAHIMLTVRSIEPSGKWAPKSRKVYDLDENGQRIFQKIDKSGRKQYKCHKEDHNNWNAAERVEEWRAAWAECCNAHLAADVQVDHRSYERQGIDLIPTVHEGYIARKLAAQGLPSDRVQINENIRKRNFLLQRLMSQLKALGKEILRLSGLREAAEVKNDVIISEFDGINKIANVKPKVRKTVPNPKIEIYDSPKQSSVFKKPTGISAVVKTMPKSESIVIEPEIQRLVGLRNKCISQGVIITWLRFNSVKNDAQADLSKAKELETNFEACVTDYFKARNNYRLHRDQDINDDNTLCLDIMKGEVVDIVCDCFYDPGKFHTLAEKGAFCDLNTFLENDPQVNRNTLNEHILELCEINNELPYLPYGYVINTLVGFSKYVGEKENWSFDDMIDLWKKMPSNSLIGGVGNLNTKDYVYLNILSMNMSSFIDFDNCKAYYNSKEFLDILNFCNSFDYGEGFYKGGEKTDAPLFLWGLHISGYDDFHANLLSYKEPITFVGYPSNNGNGTQIELTGSIMAISAMSSQEKQKGAWEFLKMFAEEEYQKNMAIPQNEDTDNGMSDNQFCFPINNKVFEELGKERYDKENESNIVSINGEETDIGYISKNEYDRLVNIINNTKRVNIHMENDIIDIINDEIWAMFADEKSPEEVAKNIQERVETMISERR